MKCRNVVFLCYSRYVIMNAYYLKKLLYKNDRCILIISDDIGNEMGIIEDITKTHLWDKVVKLNERDRAIDDIKEQVDFLIETLSIDIFCVAHIVCFASHYFVKQLGAETEINLFDEGIISLNLLSGYKFWTRNGLPAGWPEFDFSRVDNFYTYFPQITKSIGSAEIKKLDFAKLLQNNNMKETVNELNRMFNYHYQDIERDIIIIDADVASQGSVTQAYENHCVENVFRCLDTTKCVVKAKPSASKQLLKEKYGVYDIPFLDDRNVPFEVVYLNCVCEGKVPQYFVAFPTTLIWNILLINQMLCVENTKIISLSNIMKEFYLIKDNAEDMLEKIQAYQSFLDDGMSVELPNTWEEYEKITRKYTEGKCIEEYSIKSEYQWLVREYKNSTIIHEEKQKKTKYRSDILSSWIKLLYENKKIANFFIKNRIEKIVLYGSGMFAKLMYEELKNTVVEIKGVIKTQCRKDEVFEGIPICGVDDYANKKICNSFPVVVTAVGEETEIVQTLRKNNISASCIMIEEILRFIIDLNYS